MNFKFRDNLKAPIDANNLSDLIMQKKASGSFFIELVLDGSILSFRAEVIQYFFLSIRTIQIITNLQSIKNYIEEKYPSEQIFDEADLLDGALSKKKEKLLTDALYSYIVEMHSNDPSPRDIIECCKATLKLFPYLETTPSTFDGIVSISEKCCQTYRLILC